MHSPSAQIAQKGIGSSFDDFLKEEGIYEDVEAAAINKIAAELARLRLEEIESGAVQTVSAEDVFKRLSDRFGK